MGRKKLEPTATLWQLAVEWKEATEVAALGMVYADKIKVKFVQAAAKHGLNLPLESIYNVLAADHAEAPKPERKHRRKSDTGVTGIGPEQAPIICIGQKAVDDFMVEKSILVRESEPVPSVTTVAASPEFTEPLETFHRVKVIATGEEGFVQDIKPDREAGASLKKLNQAGAGYRRLIPQLWEGALWAQRPITLCTTGLGSRTNRLGKSLFPVPGCEALGQLSNFWRQDANVPVPDGYKLP